MLNWGHQKRLNQDQIWLQWRPDNLGLRNTTSPGPLHWMLPFKFNNSGCGAQELLKELLTVKCGAMWCDVLTLTELIIVTCTLGMLVQRGNSHFASYCSTSANCWEIAVKARIRHRMPKISWEMWDIWDCLKIGYIPNYSHLIGIMIINHWV